MKSRLVVLVGSLLLVGCSSMSSLQTARTLPEGHFRFIVGAGVFRTPSLSPSDPSRVSFPFLEGAMRFGFVTGWDLGLKYTAPGMFTGDLKFQIYEGDRLVFSGGIGAGYLAVPASPSPDSNYFTRDIVDLIVPTYLSYDITKGFGVYASPRFVYRWTQSEQQLLGAVVGVRIGNSLGGYVEIGGAKDLASDYSQVQLGIGVFFGKAPSLPEREDKAEEEEGGSG